MKLQRKAESSEGSDFKLRQTRVAILKLRETRIAI